MHQFQLLLEDLHREITTGSSEGSDSTRVAEVRDRIAELVREEGEHRSRRASTIAIGDLESIPPPAYELG